MAKVTISIEDLPNGKVKVVSDPTAETMFKMKLSGHELTAAHGYAFAALNKIREESRSLGKLNVLIPRIGG